MASIKWINYYFVCLLFGCMTLAGGQSHCQTSNVTCHALPPVEKGMIIYSCTSSNTELYVCGTTATYQCDKLYKLTSGSTVRTCTCVIGSMSKWNGTVPKCSGEHIVDIVLGTISTAIIILLVFTVVIIVVTIIRRRRISRKFKGSSTEREPAISRDQDQEWESESGYDLVANGPVGWTNKGLRKNWEDTKNDAYNTHQTDQYRESAVYSSVSNFNRPQPTASSASSGFKFTRNASYGVKKLQEVQQTSAEITNSAQYDYIVNRLN